MSAATFDLAITRCTSDQAIDASVGELLAILDKQGDPYLEYKISEALLFEQSATTVLEGLKREEGEYYQQRFLQLQVETELRPSPAKSDRDSVVQASDGNKDPSVYTCPACQHQQVVNPGGMNICERCEVAGGTPVFHHQPSLEPGQSRLVKGALERVRYTEDGGLCTEKKVSLLDVLVGATVVVMMGISLFFIVQTLTDDAITDEKTVIASVGVAGNKGTAVSSPKPSEIMPVATDTKQPASQPAKKKVLKSPTTNSAHSPTDINWEKIKPLLQAFVSRKPYFQKISHAQLGQEHTKLQRLLALGKPELAIVFAQGQDDSYLAALLEMKIIQTGMGKRNRVQEGDIIHHLKGILLHINHTEQGALITGNLSQIYRLLNETEKAESTLEQALTTATSTRFSPIQQLSLLMQIADDHRQFEQHEVASRILTRTEQLASSLSLTDRQQLLADLQTRKP